MIFFHTADIHYGVENYGRIDQATGIHSRLLDFNKAFSSLVDQAIEQDIDFIIFSGDAYKTAYPTPTQQKLLAEQLFRLQKAGIPVAIIVGNHDHPLSFGKANALDVFGYLPVKGFYVFSKPEIKTISTKSGEVQIVGIPWPTRNNVIAHEGHRFKNNQEIAQYLSDRVSTLIAHFAEQLDISKPAILAGHLTVSNGIFSGSEKCAIFGTDPLFLPSQLALPAFDYVALGHLHRYQNLNKGGAPAVVYSGSIERVDFGERKEEKGFCKVVINKKGAKRFCTHEFIKIEARPMLQIEVVLKRDDQTEQIIDALSHYDLKEAIIKIVYYLPEGKKDSVDLNAVHRSCQQAHYVVGVIPVHAIGQRSLRADISVDMTFPIILEHYIAKKDHLKKREKSLLKKGIELYNQIETPKES